MEGFEVVTSDDHKAGHVVETRGDWLIIEHGMLRKSRHAVPRAFAHVSDGENTIRLTVSRDIVEDSPKLNREFDERLVAEHFGVVLGPAQAPAKGYGEMVPGDPARSADQDRVRAGLETAEEERARVRPDGGEELESPALLGDRRSR